MFLPADKATILYFSGLDRITLRALTPMDPVEPNMAMFFMPANFFSKQPPRKLPEKDIKYGDRKKKAIYPVQYSSMSGKDVA